MKQKEPSAVWHIYERGSKYQDTKIGITMPAACQEQDMGIRESKKLNMNEQSQKTHPGRC